MKNNYILSIFSCYFLWPAETKAAIRVLHKIVRKTILKLHYSVQPRAPILPAFSLHNWTSFFVFHVDVEHLQQGNRTYSVALQTSWAVHSHCYIFYNNFLYQSSPVSMENWIVFSALPVKLYHKDGSGPEAVVCACHPLLTAAAAAVPSAETLPCSHCA